MKKIFISTLLCFTALVSSSLWAKPENIVHAQLIPVEKRVKAPNFYWSKKVNSQSLNGQIVYINYWAEWCSPCKEEIPFLIQLRNFYNYPVFKMIFVNTDKKEKLKEAKNFWLTKGKKAPTLYTSEFKFKNEFNVKRIPGHIILDKKGRIALQFFGSINNQKTATNIKKWVFGLIQEK
ncbi:MAG: TlpA family protein disulfide reductase [Bdellovibrionaceae bacterium]|jgi:thiol-disulfide isomerase/thioredoxin|nr:TlpA family protein disulfide reductase [Pseudobdellovibrionaceae bacterium]